jgi:branched-chain amino acid transport system substrate-binding protein
MITRRTILTVAATAALVTKTKAQTPAPTSIKIGNTMPYSGPASSYSVIGHIEAAFFNMINDQGGIATKSIHLLR